MYDKIPNKENLSEEILCEMLQFLQHKIRTKRLSLSDAEAIRRIFDEYFAKEAVAKMYYVDSAGQHHTAPYWTEESIRGIYDQVKADIRPYNFWDFYVTLNMEASDNYALIERWFPGEEGSDKDRRFVALAVNWLNDPDAQHKDCKIWCYLNE